jgi:hypothetical protein
MSLNWKRPFKSIALADGRAIASLAQAHEFTRALRAGGFM